MLKTKSVGKKICSIAKISLIFSCFSGLHSCFKVFTQTIKLIQEKLQESEKQAITKINLKIRENLKRKIKEIKVNYNKIRKIKTKMSELCSLKPVAQVLSGGARGTGGA